LFLCRIALSQQVSPAMVEMGRREESAVWAVPVRPGFRLQLIPDRPVAMAGMAAMAVMAPAAVAGAVSAFCIIAQYSIPMASFSIIWNCLERVAMESAAPVEMDSWPVGIKLIVL
ncbi:MAG: hypothetical protein AB1746_06960, partial [Candidatus Zixiibacteriota bacterium]